MGEKEGQPLSGMIKIGCKLRSSLMNKKSSSKILDISDPSILRIICKWCEGLEEDYFISRDFIMERTEPFITENKS